MNNVFYPENLFNYRFFNLDISKRLQNYNMNNLPNFIFYGPSNSGKKTLIFNLLNNIFNTNILPQTKIHNIEIKIGNNNVNVQYKSSPYHFEINLYEYGFYDKNVISDFLHKLLIYDNINVGNLKIIIVYQFDKLTENAQLCLKRMIETTYKVGRFICISNDISSLDTALISRFTTIRVPYPKKNDIIKYITYHLEKNKISFSNKDLDNIMLRSKNIFLLNLELEYIIKHKCIQFLFDKNTHDFYTEQFIKIIEMKDISSILLLRDLAYKALLVNLAPRIIIKNVTKYYLNKDFSDEFKHTLTDIAGIVSHRLSIIEYDIIALEFFTLHLKKLLIQNNSI